ncbi:ubiquitin-conjugating enzyme E2 T-like [Chelonus insularis]|uniref:ubiquitin-conjugating enzyme E2 T-like n=1 Tax=Chelonus insularis TaxID=460826 RepID=UPI001589A46C|nr:ubiquitin-conjugating enzyme E2 T-like [Chelonus insularis]
MKTLDKHLYFLENISMQRENNRLKRELMSLTKTPPEGIACYQKDDNLNHLITTIMGPKDSPYEGGLFKLDVKIEDSYPFEPPRIKFITPVYHPNIDTSGRICMDLLKMPPKGGWNPTLTLENIFVAVQLLLSHPNPDDPVMPNIANEYRFEKCEFEKKARKHTQEYAN